MFEFTWIIKEHLFQLSSQFVWHTLLTTIYFESYFLKLQFRLDNYYLFFVLRKFKEITTNPQQFLEGAIRAVNNECVITKNPEAVKPDILTKDHGNHSCSIRDNQTHRNCHPKCTNLRMTVELHCHSTKPGMCWADNSWFIPKWAEFTIIIQ